MSEMSNIHEFYVTNRELPELQRLIFLSKQEIENLPSGANVLDVGSGLTQKFARGLKEINPNINIYSVDATLAIGISHSPEYQTSVVKKNDKWDRVIYRMPDVEHSTTIPKYAIPTDPMEVRDFRVEEAAKTEGAVASLAPELPFKSNSFDLLVDIYGPGMYLQLNDPEEIIRYMKEIYRVLKPAGTARIFPAMNLNFELSNRSYNIELNLEMAKYFFNKIFKENNLFFDVHYKEYIEEKTGEKALAMFLRKK